MEGLISAYTEKTLSCVSYINAVFTMIVVFRTKKKITINRAFFMYLVFLATKFMKKT